MCDAGPLIHPDELRCLDLLADFQEVFVPNAVWEEVKQHRPSALRRRKISLEQIHSLPEPTPKLAEVTQALLLGPGEFAALRLMQQTPSAMLLTDDAAARLAAERLGFEVHGTIGVVVRSLRRQQRTKRQILNLLRLIPRKSTLFIERRLLYSIVERIARS